jgi:aryl-alcohol dehydrogenase-like predicted oxidoreductase
MRYIKLGSRDVSVIRLGAWQIGTRYWGWGTEFGPDNVSALLDAARDAGINLIDTAEIYGQGESELQLGANLPSNDDHFLIASKASPWHLGASSVQRAAARSLQRLQRPSMHLYQVHFPNVVMPLSRTMSGMRNLQREYLVEQVGVSNFSRARWARAERALGALVITNQVDYSLLKPRVFPALEPMLDDGHVMIAYSPMAMGLLSGKYNTEQHPTGARVKLPGFSARNYVNVRRVLEVMEGIAKAHTALVSQIALAWVIAHPNVIAIPGAKSPEQVRQNAEATDIQLSESEMAALDEVSESYKPAVHIPRPFEVAKWVVNRDYRW